jgi:hypothetical protein
MTTPPSRENLDELYAKGAAFYDANYDVVAWVFLKESNVSASEGDI